MKKGYFEVEPLLTILVFGFILFVIGLGSFSIYKESQANVSCRMMQLHKAGIDLPEDTVYWMSGCTFQYMIGGTPVIRSRSDINIKVGEMSR